MPNSDVLSLDNLKQRAKELSEKIQTDWANEESNGVDQEDAVALADVVQALLYLISHGN